VNAPRTVSSLWRIVVVAGYGA